MAFRTKYDRVIIYTEPGMKVVPVYGFVKNKETDLNELKQVGEKNQYAEIQSYRDSVDLNLLLARFTNGDLGALNQREAFYADTLDVPNLYRDILDSNILLERAFAALPESERAKYSGDIDQWLAQLGNNNNASGSDQQAVNVSEKVEKGVENSSEN